MSNFFTVVCLVTFSVSTFSMDLMQSPMKEIVKRKLWNQGVGVSKQVQKKSNSKKKRVELPYSLQKSLKRI